MTNSVKIKCNYSISNSEIVCLGEINILSIDVTHNTAYITWVIRNQNGDEIASKAQTCKFDNEDELIELSLANIKKYRISRNKVFLNVQLMP